MIMLMLLAGGFFEASAEKTIGFDFANKANGQPPDRLLATFDVASGTGSSTQDESDQAPLQSASGEILATPGPELLSAVQAALVDVISRCEPSIVAIARVRNDQAPRSQLDSLSIMPSLPSSSSDPASEGFIPTFFGSGIVVDPEGLIVTCAHVLDDPLKYKVFVWLDRRCYPATVVGKSAQVLASDPFSDLAVLKIEATDLKPLPISAGEVHKGDLVVALSNPYAIARDGKASASFGIVANVNRLAPRETDQPLTENIHQLGTLIQTDMRTPIGSSGGALLNWRGELVGITTNFLASSGYENPAGFAIATDNFFERVLESLKQGKLPEYGFLGVQPENLLQSDIARGLTGARLSLVIPGLPGSEAGLREGDIIYQVGSSPIINRNDLFRELSKIPTGTKAKLMIRRRGLTSTMQTIELEAELAKKYPTTNRPSYSLHSPASWRGAQVEYQSAIVGEMERISAIRTGTKVAFLNVAPNTPVWRAGLRSGYGIVSVNRQSVETPEQFLQIASSASGDVSVVATTNDGKQMTVTVSPEQ